MPVQDLLTDKLDRSQFDHDYKDEVFMLWYRSGKINSTRLHQLLPLDRYGRKPARPMLMNWMKDFEKRAEPLDQAVKAELSNRMVQEKVEMLNRHADIAVELQEKALDYLRNTETDIGSASAVRMLVEAIRIERISRGVPQVLEKMATMSDEDLLKEAEKLLLKSPITEIEPIVDYEPEEQLPDL